MHNRHSLINLHIALDHWSMTNGVPYSIYTTDWVRLCRNSHWDRLVCYSRVANWLFKVPIDNRFFLAICLERAFQVSILTSKLQTSVYQHVMLYKEIHLIYKGKPGIQCLRYYR